MKQKIVLVVGGSGGIGSAAAKLLCDAGAIVITASNDVALTSLFNVIVDQPSIYPIHVDVTSEISVLRLFGIIQDQFGKIDVLINCAGYSVFRPLTELSMEDWNQVLQVNLTGTFLCIREAFKLMKSRGGGRIINLGSVNDYLALPDAGAYAASKFGVRGLTQIINEEGKSHSIRSTLLTLGAVSTRLWDGRPGFKREEMLQPFQVAETMVHVAFLSLDIRMDEIRMFPSKGVL